MGLDMYLHKKTYVKRHEYLGDDNFKVDVTKNGLSVDYIKPERIAYIYEQVGYWRKANQIHNWFVENVQNGEDDCETYYVPEEKLENLLELCKKVLENKDSAEDILPSRKGFFFGSTEVDEWYFVQIEDTIQIIESVLAERDENGYLTGDLFYHSSW